MELDRKWQRRLVAAGGTLVLLIVLVAGALVVHETRDGPARPSAAEAAAPLRYDSEYPAMRYATRPLTGRVARVAAAIESGELELEARSPRGYLDALLAALEIDPASQLLVFSRTSLQVGGIGPDTPRAIYFNDDTYVAWVQNAPTIEIASMDPMLGPVFHTLAQPGAGEAGPERQLGRCLRCHDSYSLTGGGVPRFLLGSGYIDRNGELVSHEAWILTSPSTPLRNRWGGWYVSGRHGDAVHLGNIVVGSAAELEDLESLRIGNVDDLTGLLDTAPYPTAYSDIVAHLVIEHQIDVQNAISRVQFDATTALAEAASSAGGEAPAQPDGRSLDARIAEIDEPLVEALLMVGEVDLGARIEGTSGFRAAFESRGPTDSQGRSLRALDLQTRLFRYPLSYLIYSDAFAALPRPALDAIAARLDAILSGRDESPPFAHLSAADRRAVAEILRETKPGFLPAAGTAARP